MSSTVMALFNAANINYTGSVPWETRLPGVSNVPGVYIVSLDSNPNTISAIKYPSSNIAAITAYINSKKSSLKCSSGSVQPSVIDAKLKFIWNTDETIVYIGQSGTLKRRVSNYFTTVNKINSSQKNTSRNHSGGDWLGLLNRGFMYPQNGNQNLFVHYGFVKNSVCAEHTMISKFIYNNSRHMLPFANKEFRKHL